MTDASNHATPPPARRRHVPVEIWPGEESDHCVEVATNQSFIRHLVLGPCCVNGRQSTGSYRFRARKFRSLIEGRVCQRLFDFWLDQLGGDCLPVWDARFVIGLNEISGSLVVKERLRGETAIRFKSFGADLMRVAGRDNYGGFSSNFNGLTEVDSWQIHRLVFEEGRPLFGRFHLRPSPGLVFDCLICEVPLSSDGWIRHSVAAIQILDAGAPTMPKRQRLPN